MPLSGKSCQTEKTGCMFSKLGRIKSISASWECSIYTGVKNKTIIIKVPDCMQIILGVCKRDY